MAIEYIVLFNILRIYVLINLIIVYFIMFWIVNW